MSYWIKTSVESSCEHVGNRYEPDECPYCVIERLTTELENQKSYTERICSAAEETAQVADKATAEIKRLTAEVTEMQKTLQWKLGVQKKAEALVQSLRNEVKTSFEAGFMAACSKYYSARFDPDNPEDHIIEAMRKARDSGSHESKKVYKSRTYYGGDDVLANDNGKHEPNEKEGARK